VASFILGPIICLRTYPYSLPNPAPSTKVGVNTPAGIGQLIAMTSRINLIITNTSKLNPIAGAFQYVLS
jgi:hypothetical protein